MSLGIVIPQFRLHGESSQLSRGIHGNWKSPLKHIPFDLQEKLVTRDLFFEFAGIERVILDAEIQSVGVGFLEDLAGDGLFLVQPISLIGDVHVSQPEILGLGEIEVVEHLLQQVVAFLLLGYANSHFRVV